VIPRIPRKCVCESMRKMVVTLELRVIGLATQKRMNVNGQPLPEPLWNRDVATLQAHHYWELDGKQFVRHFMKRITVMDRLMEVELTGVNGLRCLIIQPSIVLCCGQHLNQRRDVVLEIQQCRLLDVSLQWNRINAK